MAGPGPQGRCCVEFPTPTLLPWWWECKLVQPLGKTVWRLFKKMKIELPLLLLFSHSVMSDSLWPHGLQHAWFPCPSPFPRVYSKSCLLSQWCHPTILSSVIPFSSCPQSFPASGSLNELVFQIRWPKYWSFSFSISPSNEYSGLISFRIDWFDLLAVQGILKSLLQHHSSKASILHCSAFFIVELSHPYMTTGKTIALTTQILVSREMSLFLKHCLGLSLLFF